MRLLTRVQQACRAGIRPFWLSRCLLVVLSALTVCATGCTPAAPPTSPTPAAPVSSEPVVPVAQPTPRGEIDRQPFVARSTVLWMDAATMWLSFEDEVPVTAGRFDPRANRAPANAFQIFLDPARVRPGRFEARDGAVPMDSPIRRAVVQTVNRQTRQVHVADSGWTVVLVIDRVIERKSKGGDIALSVQGRVEMRFDRPPARLGGAFAAHDLLTDDEVAPGAPTLPTPASSSSGAPAASPPATSPSRTD